MSATREDKVYLEGWHDGYKHAIDDIRQELLTLEADTKEKPKTKRKVKAHEN